MFLFFKDIIDDAHEVRDMVTTVDRHTRSALRVVSFMGVVVMYIMILPVVYNADPLYVILTMVVFTPFTYFFACVFFATCQSKKPPN